MQSFASFLLHQMKNLPKKTPQSIQILIWMSVIMVRAKALKHSGQPYSLQTFQTSKCVYGIDAGVTLPVSALVADTQRMTVSQYVSFFILLSCHEPSIFLFPFFTLLQFLFVSICFHPQPAILSTILYLLYELPLGFLTSNWQQSTHLSFLVE